MATRSRTAYPQADGAAPASAPQAALDRAGITLLVDRFYAAVRADAVLGPVFEPLLQGRWDAHLARMVDFWCTASKVERSFRGDVYRQHMALTGITPQHLARWLRLWQQHTAALFAPAAAARLQGVAVGVARVMHLGWFGELPSRAALEILVAQEAPPAAA
jgi:hemoglobin